ncbi:MAG: hypothetical protein GWN84_08520 [Gammaproteobacteria bacterium]|nr:hypothetical protein [Gammaproteobacteria bacterium]NIR82912.1 hypothetical protein [Gammaproteobacteria bacterium]NIR90180.1 hypothetical protein [Gammaproteobacteria bacterium]NIU03739.1 hypothetical protein [Gammaproteobacteria bacterium]NIV51382.1 hypothetical protein [Gammaproteobacteria bacterium]
MNPAETSMPVGVPAVFTMDEPSIGFDHVQGRWRPIDLDMYWLAGPLDSLHGTDAAASLCPSCAFFEGGRCHWCPGPEHPAYPSDRPECLGCKGRQPPATPWYQREDIMVPLLTSIAISTSAAVLSTIILRRTGFR